MADRVPRFKDQTHAILLKEWQRVNQQLRDLVLALEDFCKEHKYPPVIVTGLIGREGEHGTNSQHYFGEAADIRANQKHFTAEEIAHMDNFVSEKFWRKDANATGRQMRSFYAHGFGDNFHIHLTIDQQAGRKHLGVIARDEDYPAPLVDLDDDEIVA